MRGINVAVKYFFQQFKITVAVTEKIVAVEGPKMAVVFDGVAVEPCHDLATLYVCRYVPHTNVRFKRELTLDHLPSNQINQ